MMMTFSLSSSSSMPISLLCTSKAVKTASRKRKLTQVPAIGNFRHFRDVVGKDVEFLKKRISRGIEWANEAFHIPQVSKTLDDLVWLRNLEDTISPPVQPQTWPQPSYPELSGLDLFMADLKALEVYASYIYYLSKIWSKPLPEVYDPQDVSDYFSCRPHIVALRLLEVVSSFAFAAIRIRSSGMRNFLRSESDKDTDGSISQYYFGMVLKQTMLNLGPTFIKVGQSLSTRPDIIGTEISKALSELHDQIPPFPKSMAMKIIEEELGSPVKSFFSYISEEPIAAASFGQVYRGSTVDGSNVAVKVQRPSLHHVVVRDIYILRLGLGLFQKIAKRKSDLRLYADELGKGLVGELDYTLEADNASRFLQAHSRFAFMRMPKVFRHLSRKRVLTMEWMDGDSPTELICIANGDPADHLSVYSEKQKVDAKERLLDMVSKGVESTLVQLLETGLLHADPHSGNLRYTSSRQIGFLDFGLLCQMERKHQLAMLASIVHIVNGDWASLVQALTEMDVVRRGTNILRVTMDLEDALGEVEFKDGIPDVKFSRVLGKVWSVALKYQFRMPSYYTLVLRALASFEGLAIAADNNFKTFETAFPYVVRKLLTENSAETRKILHSVVFNNKKEFRWQRLDLFLRVGATRKVLQQATTLKSGAPVGYLPSGGNGVSDAVNLVLRLLTSKDGTVLRRLLMTVDEASLVRAIVSREASSFRQELGRVIASVIYQWLFDTVGQGKRTTKYSSQVRLTGGPDDRHLDKSPRLSSQSYDYQSLMKDRRLKVILSKVLDSTRRYPILMLRFCWATFVMFVTASFLACHRLLVSLSEAYLSPLSFGSKRLAMSM